MSESGEDRFGYLRVVPGEDAAAGGRKAEAQDGGLVDVGRVARDLIFQCAERFEEHRQEEPVGDGFRA